MKKNYTIAGLLTFALCTGAFAEADYGLSSADILKMETRLVALGYIKTADEYADDETSVAISTFQEANGIKVTGNPNERTLESLYADEAVSKQDYIQSYYEECPVDITLQYGDTGTEVRTLQKKLKDYGYLSGKADGIFGTQTHNAVMNFQMANGLVSDGIADACVLRRLMYGDPLTWNEYVNSLNVEYGTTGIQVHAIQKRLITLGYYEGETTGVFGLQTESALKSFQHENRISETGFADVKTVEMLFSDNAKALQKDTSLTLGSFGEDVSGLQNRLMTLGYFADEISGEFTEETKTAVLLFQIANELPLTGRLDVDTETALDRSDALMATDEAVTVKALECIHAVNESTFTDIADLVESMIGFEFASNRDGNYPGFAFVRHACACMGIPFGNVQTLYDQMSEREWTEDIVRGSIVLFEEPEDLLFAIAIGENRIAYATSEGGWVVMSRIDDIDYICLRVWGPA